MDSQPAARRRGAIRVRVGVEERSGVGMRGHKIVYTSARRDASPLFYASSEKKVGQPGEAAGGKGCMAANGTELGLT